MSTSLKTNLSKVLNQDACEAVLKWSEQAPKAELEVVAKFFQQVAKEEGVSGQSKLPDYSKLRNTDVLKIIRDRNKRLRLLTPETRRKKAEFQTWHHMPVKKDKDYEFIQSHYHNARPPARRHYVIHPDWYP